jgi:hypothetical protein
MSPPCPCTTDLDTDRAVGRKPVDTPLHRWSQGRSVELCRHVLTDQMMNTSSAITMIDHHG